MERPSPESARRWYRYPWVWALMIPPLAAVIFWTVILLTTAASPSLVIDDYARAGLTYQRDTERSAAAAERGLSARVHVVRADGGVTVLLEGDGPYPDSLQMRLAHPAEAARDVRVELVRGEAGIYRGGAGRALDADRLIEILPSDGDWRLTGRLDATRSETRLTPPGP